VHHRIEAAELEHEDDTVISLQISIGQCADLASGYVPLAVNGRNGARDG
jgi:hypothetical protein